MHTVFALVVLRETMMEILARSVFNSIGIVLMPVSGFYLLLVPALAILVGARTAARSPRHATRST